MDAHFLENIEIKILQGGLQHYLSILVLTVKVKSSQLLTSWIWIFVLYQRGIGKLAFRPTDNRLKVKCLLVLA